MFIELDGVGGNVACHYIEEGFSMGLFSVSI